MRSEDGATSANHTDDGALAISKASMLTSSSLTSPLTTRDDDSPLISDPRPALELGVVQWHTVAATARMSIRLRRVHARHSQPDWRTTIRRWCQQLALPGPPWAINNELASLSDGLGFCRVGGTTTPRPSSTRASSRLRPGPTLPSSTSRRLPGFTSWARCL